MVEGLIGPLNMVDIHNTVQLQTILFNRVDKHRLYSYKLTILLPGLTYTDYIITKYSF